MLPMAPLHELAQEAMTCNVADQCVNNTSISMSMAPGSPGGSGRLREAPGSSGRLRKGSGNVFTLFGIQSLGIQNRAKTSLSVAIGNVWDPKASQNQLKCCDVHCLASTTEPKPANVLQFTAFETKSSQTQTGIDPKPRR